MPSFDTKLIDERHKYRIKCKCGHIVHIYPFERRNKKICSWCKHYVYINHKEEFKEKVKEARRNGKSRRIN